MDDALASRARRALELGRLRVALTGAALVTGVLALILQLAPTPLDVRALALPFVAWTCVAWRGGSLARGGAFGLFAGVAGWLVPMSLLRPCCATMAATSADCCTRPDCCLEAGALIGIVLALCSPIDLQRRSFAERIAGTLLIAGATLGMRCTGLFVGESIGLLGGLALGAVATSAARAWMTRLRTA